MREMFGLACMALLVHKSEKMVPASDRTGYIIETENAIRDHVNQGTVVPLSTPSEGFLPLLLSFVFAALSLLGDELINMALYLMLNNGLLPLTRVLRRVFIAGYRRVCGSWAHRRVIEGDVTHNTHQSTGEIDDLSRSTQSQAATATPSDGPHWLSRYFYTFHVTIAGNGPLEPQPSPAEIPNNTPVAPTNDHALEVVRAESARKDERIARKDQYTLRLTQTARANSSTIARLNGRNSRLLERLRTNLDPKGIYSPNTNVVLIANHLQKDFKRVSKKILRQRGHLENSHGYQQGRQLVQKSIEIAALSAEIRRLKDRALGLERGQQSSVEQVKGIERAAREQVKDIERAAREREEKLRNWTRAAERRASDAIDPRTYETLRNQFDAVRDAYLKARDEKKAALAELQAEKAKTETEIQTQPQSESPVTVVADGLQEAISKIADLEREATTKDGEAERKAQEAEARVQEAETRARGAERRVQFAEGSNVTLQQNLQIARDSVKESDKSRKELEERIRGLKETMEQSKNNAQGPIPADAQSGSQQEASTQTDMHDTQADQAGKDAAYQQGHQAAVRQCEERASVLLADAVDRERQQAQGQMNAAVNTAVADRDSAWTAELNAQVENAVASRESSLRAELDTALQRAVTAEGLANNSDATLRVAQSAFTTAQAAATSESHRANEAERKASTEHSRAEAAEEEVRKFRQGKLSQDGRIKKHLDEIATLKRQMPRNTEWAAAHLNFVKADRRRAYAIIGEASNRSYDWATKQVLERLVDANKCIINLERLLRDPERLSSQIVLQTALLDAEVPRDMYTKLDQAFRLVLVKQCKAVNARLDELKTIINQSERPDQVRLLTEVYKVRGDEDVVWDEDEESEASSDEDEDEDRSRAQTPAPGAPRELRRPTLRGARPAAVTQVQDTPEPSDLRGNPQLKRKEAHDDAEASASSKRQDASDRDMRPIAGPSRPSSQQGLSSPETADDPMKTEPESQNELSSSERGEASASQPRSNDQTDISSRLPSAPFQHFSSSYPATSSETPSHLEHAPRPKPTRIPGPKPKPILTASERQQRLRYRQQPGSEAVSVEETSASSSAQGPTNFSFSMPKNIASGIRPHVRKYTRLSGITNKCA